MHPIFTIGHSNRPADAFIELLKESGVETLIDVRSIPRSRTNPQFNLDVLAGTLQRSDIAFEHIAVLGGRRYRRKDLPPSENSYWQVAAFQAYADHAQTAEFGEGLERLIELARRERVAIMCSEAVWWRCHRRIIADYLLVRGLDIRHILAPGNIKEATMTPGGVAQPDGTLRYPPA